MQPGTNPFVAPTVGAGALTPGARELQGRLVAFQCTHYDPQMKGYENNPPTPGVIATVYIFDGGPLYYGAKADGSRPNTHVVATPTKFDGFIDQHVNIVRALAPGGRPAEGVVLGRIVRSDVGQRPWNLQALDPNNPNDAAAQRFAIETWNAWATGQAVPAQPQELNPQPSAPPQYAPQPAPAYAYPPQAPAQNMIQPQPGYTPGQPMATPYPAQPAPVPQYAAPQPPPAAQAMPMATPPPLGWDPSMWAAMSPAQQAQILSAQAQYGTGAPGQPNPL